MNDCCKENIKKILIELKGFRLSRSQVKAVIEGDWYISYGDILINRKKFVKIMKDYEGEINETNT